MMNAAAELSVFEAVMHFFTYAVMAVFAENIVFTHALGVSQLFKLVETRDIRTWHHCLPVFLVQLFSAPLVWLARVRFVPWLRTILPDWLPMLALRPLVYLSCATIAMAVVWAVLRLPESRRTPALEKIVRDKLSVRQADKLVDSMLAAPKAPSPCRKTIPMVRDVRFFVNTLQHAVDLMTQKGIAATTSCDKRDGCLEYIVRIPVNSDGQMTPAPPSPAPVAAETAPPDPPETVAADAPLREDFAVQL